jgi:hypothetical protein
VVPSEQLAPPMLPAETETGVVLTPLPPIIDPIVRICRVLFQLFTEKAHQAGGREVWGEEFQRVAGSGGDGFGGQATASNC